MNKIYFENPIIIKEVEKLTLLMSHSHWNLKEKKLGLQLLNSILKDSEKIKKFEFLIKYHQIEGHVALHLSRILNKNMLHKLNNSTFHFIKKQFNSLKLMHNERISRIQPILNEFKKAQIPWILLKGNAISKSIYKCSHYKKMNDIDILVRKSDLEMINAIYKKFQLISFSSLSEKSHRDQESYSHHWPSFSTPDLKCIIGTHWNLANPFRLFSLNESDWWNHIEPIQFAGFDGFRLSTEDFLHHLCFHLPYYKTGLKEMADIFNFTRKYHKKINVKKFTQKVIKSKTFNPVLFHLIIANQMSPQKILKKIINELANAGFFLNWPENQLLKHKIKSTESLLNSKSFTIENIEKSFALFQIAPNSIEKIKFLTLMWRHFLLPKDEDLKRLDFIKPTNLILRRTRAPWILSWYFAKDLGWKLHFILLISHHFNAIKSIQRDIQYLVTGKPILSLNQLLASKGVQPDVWAFPS